MKKMLALLFYVLLGIGISYAGGGFYCTKLSTVTRTTTAILNGTFKVYNSTPAAVSNFEITGGTITKCSSIILSTHTYTTVEVTTGTLILADNYNLYICTGVAGTTRLWGKFGFTNP